MEMGTDSEPSLHAAAAITTNWIKHGINAVKMR